MFGFGVGGLAPGGLAETMGAKSPFVNSGVTGPKLGEASKKDGILGVFWKVSGSGGDE